MESSNEERLKMRIAVLEESVKSCELECKASRETVMRLVTELEQEKRKTASSAAALGSLRVELDDLTVGRRSVEMEKQTLSESLESSRRVIEAARRESDCLDKQVEELQRKAQAAQGKLQTFLGMVAGLLQGGSENVILPAEKDILQKLDNLCNKMVPEMEVRLCRVTEELKRQTELQQSTLQRAQLAEQQVQELGEKVCGLEAELLNADVHRDSLQHSRQHHEEFLDKLSDTMRVDSIAVDLSSDMRLKLILSRAEQLVKHEAAALVETRSLTYSLQRKVKSQKDQLDSKGLHIQLLRKKVSELEDEKRSRSALAGERDNAHLEARRLQKKLELLQGDLRAAKFSNTELKAKLAHANELKSKVMEQNQTMQEQKQKLEQLVDGRAKAEKKLSSDLQSQERKSREDREQLSTLRQSLARLSERQRELVDFRTVVSHMLGLDATASALPDNDIIKLLETLLHHHHHHRLRHCVNVPEHCCTPRFHLPLIRDLPGSRSPSRSACRGDAVTLHKT